MRWLVLWISSAVLSCAPGPLPIDWPRVEGSGAAILVIQKNGELPRIFAIDQQGTPPLLPTIDPIGNSDRLTLRSLYYRQSLRQLGLHPGRQATPAPGLGRPLPPPEMILALEMLGSAGAPPWTATPFTADLEPLRLPCPEVSLPALGAIDSPTGCPLPAVDRGPICWDHPTRWDALDQEPVGSSTRSDLAGSTVIERGRSYLYFASTRFAVGSSLSKARSYTRPVRVELQTSTRAIAGTIEDLPIIPSAASGALGWTMPPRVRSDGLEMFFQSSWPSGAFCDEQLLESWRPSLDQPWTEARPLSSLALPHPIPNCDDQPPLYQQKGPILLPDYRTLLYWDDHRNRVMVARRTSSTAGDLSFVELPDVLSFDLTTRDTVFDSLALSCDQSHLVYTRYDRDPSGLHLASEPRIVPLLSLDPLVFGGARALPVLPGAPIAVPTDPTLWVSEASDCRGLYLSDSFAIYRSARAPTCP